MVVKIGSHYWILRKWPTVKLIAKSLHRNFRQYLAIKVTTLILWTANYMLQEKKDNFCPSLSPALIRPLAFGSHNPQTYVIVKVSTQLEPAHDRKQNDTPKLTIFSCSKSFSIYMGYFKIWILEDGNKDIVWLQVLTLEIM